MGEWKCWAILVRMLMQIRPFTVTYVISEQSRKNKNKFIACFDTWKKKDLADSRLYLVVTHH